MQVTARHVKRLIIAYALCSFVAITIWFGIGLAIGIDINKDEYYCSTQVPPSERNFQLHGERCRLNIDNIAQLEGRTYVIVLVLANLPAIGVLLLYAGFTGRLPPSQRLPDGRTADDASPSPPPPHPRHLPRWVALPSAALMGVGIAFWIWLAVDKGAFAARWILSS